MREYSIHIPFVCRILITVFILAVIIPVEMQGQDRKTDLQNEKKQIEADIAYTNQLLTKTRVNRKSSMDVLAILQQKILQRERLINTVKAQLVLIEHEIEQTDDSIFSLSVELKKLKEEYAKMIYYANRNRNAYDRLIFIFSADDFNQAYRRIRYFQQYSAYRRTQAALITSTQDELSRKELELEQQKAEQKNLLAGEEREKLQLEQEKLDVSQTITDLGQRERQLKADLQAKEKAVAELEKAIADIIAEEIRLAEERARAEAVSTTTSSGGFALTPEEKLLSEDFANNKGKLPWPTERGVVSSTFGEHQHPVLKRVTVKNNGIDILTSEGEYARAVFNGEVTRVISVPNFNNVVIIRHGEFLSVYSNLDEVLVSKGQKVSTKQNIGKVYTNRSENKTKLHFEIWQAKELKNPSHWLAGK